MKFSVFMIYSKNAKKREPGYSEKEYSAPHRESGKESEGMKDWVSWYCIKRDEAGIYYEELDEAWNGGNGHNDGGTMCNKIPKEWFDLKYDEFLENLVTLSSASRYGFKSEELKEKEGLKEFLGF